MQKNITNRPGIFSLGNGSDLTVQFLQSIRRVFKDLQAALQSSKAEVKEKRSCCIFSMNG